MNITDAAHKTVKDYPGGSEALEAMINLLARLRAVTGQRGVGA